MLNEFVNFGAFPIGTISWPFNGNFAPLANMLLSHFNEILPYAFEIRNMAVDLINGVRVTCTFRFNHVSGNKGTPSGARY